MFKIKTQITHKEIKFYQLIILVKKTISEKNIEIIIDQSWDFILIFLMNFTVTTEAYK